MKGLESLYLNNILYKISWNFTKREGKHQYNRTHYVPLFLNSYNAWRNESSQGFKLRVWC